MYDDDDDDDEQIYKLQYVQLLKIGERFENWSDASRSMNPIY